MTQKSAAAEVRAEREGARTPALTQTMRAAATIAGPRVLRVAMVREGRILDEQLLVRRRDLSIGTSEKATWIVLCERLPPSFRLFEATAEGYRLHFTDGMTVELKERGELERDEAVKRRSRRTSHDAHVLTLDDSSKGKVVVGGTTFLFQFAPAPPGVARVPVPTSWRGLEVDWSITIVAAFSFLLHFLGFGGIYTDWTDPVVSDDLDVAQLLEDVKRLPPPPPPEQPRELVEEATIDTAAKVTTATPTDAPTKRAAGGAAGSNARASSAEDRARQISSDLAAMDVAMMAVIDARGTSTDRVLSTGELPLDRLSEAARDGRPARSSLSALSLDGDARRAFVPGEAPKHLGADVDRGKQDANPDSGRTTPPKGPNAGTFVGGPEVSGTVADAASVVAGMAPGFRRCYRRGLEEDATMKGSVRITAKIGVNGEVLGASPSGGSGLSPTVIACVAARVASAQFAPPGNGGATLVIPVSFQPQ
jgi:hypothetical protein